MKKIISFLLILSLLLPCLIACGKEDEESKERREPVVLDSDSELVLSLVKYLFDYFKIIDYNGSTVSEKIDLIKSKQFALLVDLNVSRPYFVCAYYNSQHAEEYFCCADNYIWVQYQNAEDINDSYDGNAFVCAIQLNRSLYSKDIFSEETNTHNVDYLCMFEPKFANGVNIEPPIKINKGTFIYIAHPREKETCYISRLTLYPSILYCERSFVTGKSYLRFNIHSIKNGEIVSTNNYSYEFGEYYDELMSVMKTKIYKSSEGELDMRVGGLISIEDFVRIIKDE